MPAATTATRPLTRADHGRPMSLAEFEFVEVEEGLHVELSRGLIQVSDVPDIEHFKVEESLRDPLILYRLQNPRTVFAVMTSNAMKLLVPDTDAAVRPVDRCRGHSERRARLSAITPSSFRFGFDIFRRLSPVPEQPL